MSCIRCRARALGRPGRLLCECCELRGSCFSGFSRAGTGFFAGPAPTLLHVRTTVRATYTSPDNRPQHGQEQTVTDHPTPPTDGDWLAPTPEGPAETLASPARAPRARWLKAATVVAAGVITGGGVAFAAGHGTGSGGTTVASTAGSSVSGANPEGGFDGHSGAGAGGHFGDGNGDNRDGIDGEQHVQGTLTAIGASSITVEAATGAHTYQVTGTTEIMNNGKAATLSQLKTGTQVLVHVYPATSGNQLLVERLFAGTLPAFGDGRGPGGHPSDGDGGPGDGDGGPPNGAGPQGGTAPTT